LLWQNVGIIRETHLLEHALAQLLLWQNEAEQQGWQTLLPEGKSFTNQLQLARWITQAALKRTESIGAHCRIDSPRHSEAPTTRLSHADYPRKPKRHYTPPKRPTSISLL
jgi:aspartate oxidase